jgi:hypothetical protein
VERLKGIERSFLNSLQATVYESLETFEWIASKFRLVMQFAALAEPSRVTEI